MALVIAPWGVACNKPTPPSSASAPTPTSGGLPPLEGAAAGNPHGGGMPGNPHGGGMPMDPHGGAVHPTEDPATPGGIAFDQKTVLTGDLVLTPATKDKVKEGDTIFFSVRAAPAEGSPVPGPILAVKRGVAGAVFPQKFAIDGRDAMMVGTSLAGKVVITVRVDKDDNATTKNPGDVVGVSAVVEPPQTKLVINLDKVL